jgi:hypothetical protein
MNRSPLDLTIYAALFSIAACAGGTAPGAASAPKGVAPPQMMVRAGAPALHVPITASGRSPVRVTIEVLIDTTGRADMTTLKITGYGAAENHDALAHWIEESIFQPAHQGDQPVPGFYRTKLEARVVRR